MTSKEGFCSIKAEAVAELTVKDSKFIAHAAPSANQEKAEKYVTVITNKFQDATHNCYAYKIGVGDRCIFRFNDAGEPSGTAGRPILQAIERKKLTHVVVVVARYFGGTKLGTGGLMRAYKSAALAALDKAMIVKYYPQIALRLKFSYQQSKAVHQVLAKYGVQIIESQFKEMIDYLIKLKVLDEKEFVEALNNFTGGKIAIEVVDEI
ncbi:MAG: IMPACT family protein [bacterium]